MKKKMKNIISCLIISAQLVQGCKTKVNLVEHDFVKYDFETKDSIEFKIVTAGYRDCIIEPWETLWYPSRKGLAKDSILWFSALGLLDSVEIVVAHQTIFKGMLKDFYNPELEELVYHATYYNRSHHKLDKLPVLAIINYSRQGYQEAFLVESNKRRETSTIFYYFPIENRLTVSYNNIFSHWLDTQQKGYVKRATTNLNR